MRIILIIVSLFISVLSFGQITFTNTDTISNAGQGDLYMNTDTGVYYIGLDNGTLKEIGIVTQKGATDNQILGWNDTNQTWEPKAPTTGALVITKETIHSSDRARVLLNPATNINAGATFNLIPFDFQLNETAATIAGNTITGLVGNVKFTVQINLNSAAERTNFKIQLLLNGTLYNRLSGPFYARNASGHNETGGQAIFEYEGATATDSFSFVLEREANAGTVALVSNGTDSSFVFIEQFKTLEVVTDITAPIDLAIAQGPAGPIGPQGNQGVPGPPIGAPTDVYHATGSVGATGVANYIQGATVARIGVGRYRVTFLGAHSNGANYPVLFSMEQNPGVDDYVPTYTAVTPTTFIVEIGEQDNGTTGGVFRDAGFSFYVPL